MLDDKTLIVAVDFDGILVEDDFPGIGKPIPEMVEYVRKLKADGHKLILWTCRNGSSLDEAVEWCHRNFIHFDAINANIKEIQEEWGGDTRKVYCDFYIDDKALNPYGTRILGLPCLPLSKNKSFNKMQETYARIRVTEKN